MGLGGGWSSGGAHGGVGEAGEGSEKDSVREMLDGGWSDVLGSRCCTDLEQR
jgi:hypothetical protein